MHRDLRLLRDRPPCNVCRASLFLFATVPSGCPSPFPSRDVGLLTVNTVSISLRFALHYLFLSLFIPSFVGPALDDVPVTEHSLGRQYLRRQRGVSVLRTDAGLDSTCWPTSSPPRGLGRAPPASPGPSSCKWDQDLPCICPSEGVHRPGDLV